MDDQGDSMVALSSPSLTDPKYGMRLAARMRFPKAHEVDWAPWVAWTRALRTRRVSALESMDQPTMLSLVPSRTQ